MIFTAIGAAIGIIGSFFGGLGAIGTFALNIGASIGLSYVAQALAGKPKQASQIAGQASHFSVQTTVARAGNVPRSFNVGYSATAGSLVYMNDWGNSGQTPNAYHTDVIALGDLPGDSLAGVWVGAQKCSLGPTAHPDFGYPLVEYNKNGADHLWVKFYDGTQTTADAFLVNKVSSADRPYNSTRVGVGCPYAIVTALVDDTLFTSVPTGQVKFELNGIKLYDPTKDGTNGGSGSHRWSNPTTWGGDGDNLPAVQAYNIMRGLTFGGTWFYGLQGMTAARLPTANWIDQINKCRAGVAIDGGTEPQYRTGGQVNVNAPISDVLEALMTGCQGKISETGGFYSIHLGAPDEAASASITDDVILSSEEQSFAPFFGLADSINGIAATYPSPADGWNTKSAPALYNPDYEARDGGRRLLASPSLDFVPYDGQAQRLQKSGLLEARRERRHSLSLPPEYWPLEPGDVISWTSVRNGYDAKLFRVDGIIDKANLDVTINITEVDPADYDWDPAADFTPVTSGPTSFPRPAPQGVIDWDVQPVTIRDADGFPRRAGLDWTWDNTLAGVIGIRYELRLKSDQSFAASDSTDRFSEGAWLTSQSLLPNTRYQARIQYIPSAPRDMLWSDWRDVTTLDVRFTANDLDQAFVRYTATLNGALDNVVRALDILANNASEQDLANANEFKTTRDILTRQVGELKVSITETAAIAEGIDGRLTGVVFNKIDNNGFVSGTINYNDGRQAPFTILATSILAAHPSINGGDPVPFFLIDGTVDGQAAVTLNGALHGDLSITARSLEVENLAAIKADFGDARFKGKASGGPTGNLDLDFSGGNIVLWADE